MSITTGKGDDGTTCVMFNRRVPKWHPNVEACGTVDELSAALGVVRSMCRSKEMKERIFQIQNDLIGLMGELATLPQDMEVYQSSGFKCLKKEDAERLYDWIKEYSKEIDGLRGWAIPGETKLSAAIELARAICRRAERRVCFLQRRSKNFNQAIIVYLNRLGDLLWLMARITERKNAR
ncbi:MAG: cob(I)yrinic acid a,c-diamide adenosyltransferase [Verrucomicrobiae bacterium]|nr:cob(I)yrinic acid a,c-diamide adenosyltransferase [Verrucomicrobiae bacterium]